MAPALSLANISRVLDLIGAPLTLEILDGLGHGIAPADAVPAYTEPAAILAALDHLQRFGAVSGTFPGTDDALSLTPLGRRLLEALEKAESINDTGVTA